MSDEPVKKYKLGDFIEISCRYCRLNLDAVVTAFAVDGTIAKVQCRTCMHFQNFKPPADFDAKHRKLVDKAMKIANNHTGGPEGPAAQAKARASAKAKAGDLSAEAVMRRVWDDATANVTPMKMKMYDKHRVYHKEDVISHKAHGLGVVLDDGGDYQINVLFRDGFVLLEHDIPREE
jgi:hypothetical protein